MHENGTGQQTTKTLTQKDKIGGKNIDQKTNEEGRKWRRLAQTQDDNRKNLKISWRTTTYLVAFAK